MNLLIMSLYYLMTGYFACCMAISFYRTKNAQKAILYLIVMMPFVLRVLRLK